MIGSIRHRRLETLFDISVIESTQYYNHQILLLRMALTLSTEYIKLVYRSTLIYIVKHTGGFEKPVRFGLILTFAKLHKIRQSFECL